jgi:N-acetylglucosaminyl-diphospho-decaprenol L-rhamnosyltransferase
MPSVGIVTVTYNSGKFFRAYMDALQAQTRAVDLLVLIDSGSDERAFLDDQKNYTVPTKIISEGNVGVCVGNNIGWRIVRDFDYIMFLNPDAFIAPNFLELAVAYMETNPSVGMVTPTLLGYDIEKHEPTGLVDTTGVVRTWYGRIAERDQSKLESVLTKYAGPNEIPWLCSAVALARREAMEAIVDNESIFDPIFFMYKDDTDVSWRVRRAGWKIIHNPELRGYHCRGWKSRKGASQQAKLLSARNEIKLYIKNRSPFLIAAWLKYALVKWFGI